MDKGVNGSVRIAAKNGDYGCPTDLVGTIPTLGVPGPAGCVRGGGDDSFSEEVERLLYQFLVAVVTK